MPHVRTDPWLVQKFGGTSIGKLLQDITDTIIPSHLQTHQVAVVCSARSSRSKSEGTTSLLLDAIRVSTSYTGTSAEVDAIVDCLERDHLIAMAKLVEKKDDERMHDAQDHIRKDCKKLRSILAATRVLGEISERTVDKVLAVGETMACRVVAASLETQVSKTQKRSKHDTYRYDREFHPKSSYSMISYNKLTFWIRQACYNFIKLSLQFSYMLLPAKSGRKSMHAKDTFPSSPVCSVSYPVVVRLITAGFFGTMPGGLIESVSRGYSDLCAALCAVAVNAEELQIWKELDGIYTADPHKIKAARLLATVTSEEAAELTFYGSEVIHPLTMEQINGASIPLRLKNVMNPQGKGTIIYPSRSLPLSSTESGSPMKLPIPVSGLLDNVTKLDFMTANGYYGPSQCRRSPTAITVKERITILNIKSRGTTAPQAFLVEVSSILKELTIAIDLVTSSRQMLSLALCAPKQADLGTVTTSLEGSAVVSLVENMSIISVIGHKMRNMVGVAAEIFTALAHARVNIYLISQGASEINIS